MAAGTQSISGYPKSEFLRAQVGSSRLAVDIARPKCSYTGQFLKPVLERRENKRKAKIEAAE